MSGTDFFFDISTADFPALIQFFVHDFQFISIYPCILLQHMNISAFLMSKMKVCPDRNIRCMELIHQHFFDERLCFHAGYLLRKWTVNQIICLSIEMLIPFFPGHQTFLLFAQSFIERSHVKCKDNTYHLFGCMFLHTADQFLMASVQAVKFPQCHCSFSLFLIAF